MQRREFIIVIGALAGCPLSARAQQPKIAKIGVLVAGIPDPQPLWSTFQIGYVEGQQVQFEYRSAEGYKNRLNDLAADLVCDNVDVIVTFQTPTVTAAKQATQSIPIVMASAGDPVGAL